MQSHDRLSAQMEVRARCNNQTTPQTQHIIKRCGGQ